MEPSQKHKMHEIIKTYITPTLLLTVVFYLGINFNRLNTIMEHVNDNEKHMPYSEKVKTFVLRDNYDYDRLNVKDDILEMKSTLLDIQLQIRNNH